MADSQQVGRVIRTLPGQRVVVQLFREQVTATSPGMIPRPGAEALVTNPGSGWVVLSWQ